ncbi:MAG: flagellar assembly peptidoglycan hydrolase FlgJ [Pseudomonadota bacterium]
MSSINTEGEHAFIYHDRQSLIDIRKQAQNEGQKEQALLQAAKHFESIFLKMMLKSMRSANEVLFEGGLFDSHQQKFYQEMHDDQLALTLSAGKGLGLAEIMVRQLTHQPAAANKQNLALPARVVSLPSADSSSHNTAKVLETAKIENALIKEMESTTSLSLQQVAKAQGVLPQQTVIDSKLLEQAQENQSFTSPLDFIQQLKPYAEKAAKLMGISPLFMLAQAALETGWGKHVMQDTKGESSYNLFGIKADKRWDGNIAVKPTLEFENNLPIKKQAKFRSYSNYQESFLDYVTFLQSNPRYTDALNNTKDAEKYFTSLQKSGYATDPQYAKKILNVLKNTAFNQE